MLAMRRVFVVMLTLAILALASIPASASERRAFVSPQVALDWNLNAVSVVRGFRNPSNVPYYSFSANAEGASPDAAVIAATYRTLLNYQGDLVTGGTTLTAKYTSAI